MAGVAVKFSGVSAAPGCVVGPYLIWRKTEITEPKAPSGIGLAPEIAAAHVGVIKQAARDVADQLLAAAQADREKEGLAADILETTAQIALDSSIFKKCAQAIEQAGASNERAVWDAYNEFAAQLEAMGGYMAERVADLYSVRDRIVARLTGVEMAAPPSAEHPVILVAPNLEPADTAALDTAAILGLVTAGGGPTSHTAILARALGIPAVVAAPTAYAALEKAWLEAGEEERRQLQAALDGGAGTVILHPDQAAIDQLHEAARHQAELAATPVAVSLKDGTPVSLLANIGSLADAREAVERGARGVGLFRTEFAFLGQATEPSVGEQAAAYQAIFDLFPGQKVVIRTLDAGSDKPLDFIPSPPEDNPALGVRGLRTVRLAPQVLERQLQAIAQAAAASQAEVWVMAPMVATVEETTAFLEAGRQVGLERLGIMVETPAAALQAGALLGRGAGAEFISLGTNDLTQYTMAADRQLGDLAELNSPWQPAVLQLMSLSFSGAREQGKMAGVCGEAAADPLLAPVLLGLGATYLSMGTTALGPVSAVLSKLTLEHCQHLADLALRATTASEAQTAVGLYLADLL